MMCYSVYPGQLTGESVREERGRWTTTLSKAVSHIHVCSLYIEGAKTSCTA